MLGAAAGTRWLWDLGSKNTFGPTGEHNFWMAHPSYGHMDIHIYIIIYQYIYIWDDELHFCLASLVWNRPSRRPVILLLQAKCGKITGRNRVTGGFKYVSLSTWFGMMIPALRRHQTFIKDPKFHGHFPGNRGFTTGFFMWTSLKSRMFHHTKRVACVAFPGATDAGEPNGTCCATPQVTWPWQRAVRKFHLDWDWPWGVREKPMRKHTILFLRNLFLWSRFRSKASSLAHDSQFGVTARGFIVLVFRDLYSTPFATIFLQAAGGYSEIKHGIPRDFLQWKVIWIRSLPFFRFHISIQNQPWKDVKGSENKLANYFFCSQKKWGEFPRCWDSSSGTCFIIFILQRFSQIICHRVP